ncbi:MAG: hypothetical protein GVY25_02665 [Bacteroidetes bacterium]|nr:hypothetical protein [Bacteroidota bacterium]
MLILACPVFSYAQISSPASPRSTTANEAQADVVVARFLVDIDGLESGFPEDQKAGGLVPKALRGRENVRLTREAVATLRTPDGTPVDLAIDSLFAIVADELQELDLQVLPSDTLCGTVPYLLGYPMGSAGTVIGNATHTRGLEVEIDETVPGQGVLGRARNRAGGDKGRPEMELAIRYVDAAGRNGYKKHACGHGNAPSFPRDGFSAFADARRVGRLIAVRARARGDASTRSEPDRRWLPSWRSGGNRSDGIDVALTNRC